MCSNLGLSKGNELKKPIPELAPVLKPSLSFCLMRQSSSKSSPRLFFYRFTVKFASGTVLLWLSLPKCYSSFTCGRQYKPWCCFNFLITNTLFLRLFCNVGCKKMCFSALIFCRKWQRSGPLQCVQSLLCMMQKSA